MRWKRARAVHRTARRGLHGKGAGRGKAEPCGAARAVFFLLIAVEDRDAKKRQPAVPVDPKIAEYLDTLEQEFAPLRPNMIPGDELTGSARR